MREDEFPAYCAAVEQGYAREIEEYGGIPAEQARKKAARDVLETLGGGLGSPGQDIYVIEEEGERVGVLWVSERESQGARVLWVYDVEIEERFRGRGLGRAAMRLCEEQAARRGIGRVELNVFGGNAVARNLYRSLDYHEVSVWMGKDL